jgi:hypothetical protein
VALFPDGYLLAMYCLSAPRNSQEFLGADRQYSRNSQAEGRRYVWATFMPRTRECIYETEHLGSVHQMYAAEAQPVDTRTIKSCGIRRVGGA